MNNEKTRLDFEDLFIHFDVENHQIPVEQSIITEDSVKIIIEEFNKIFFNEQLEIKIFVLPEEPGGLFKRFGAVILIGGGFVLGQLAPDIMNGVVMGVGDGREVKEYIRDGVKYFLEKDTVTLENKGFSKEQFHKAYQAKNKFYISAIDNKNLKGLGFDHSDNFSVLPNQFPYRVAMLDGTKKDKIIRQIHSLKVVSTINAKENSADAWRVKNMPKGTTEHVYMKDKNFYDFYWKKDLKVHTLLAQLKYTIEEDELGNMRFKEKGKEIEIVFEYNGISFSPPPSAYQIETFPLQLKEKSINNFEEISEDDANQMDLFDNLQ